MSVNEKEKRKETLKRLIAVFVFCHFSGFLPSFVLSPSTLCLFLPFP